MVEVSWSCCDFVVDVVVSESNFASTCIGLEVLSPDDVAKKETMFSYYMKDYVASNRVVHTSQILRWEEKENGWLSLLVFFS